jgi:ribosomal protein S12 methylthiotransferase
MPNLCLISLGCSKNTVTSEKILAEYKYQGYNLITAPEKADVIIINTCSFIDSATEESILTIRQMAQYNAKIYVAGCLVERFGNELYDILPEIDGTINADNQAEKRLLSTPRGTAFLKIAEGCNNACTFCVLPKIKGRYTSFPRLSLLKEAKSLANQGVRELIIIAQDTGPYQDGKYDLPDLLTDLAKIKGIKWIRLHYCYPEHITDKLIRTIKTNPKILHYIDMPIQHASDKILTRMGRKSRKQDLTSLITELRTKIPDIVLRTTLMVGFPSETDDDFRELMDFVEFAKFERLGAFCFSPQDETAAAHLPDQIAENIKNTRYHRLMSAQQRIALNLAKSQIGKTLDCIVQTPTTARTYADSPEVDCLVNLDKTCTIGDIIKVTVTDTNGYDLVGKIE